MTTIEEVIRETVHERSNEGLGIAIWAIWGFAGSRDLRAAVLAVQPTAYCTAALLKEHAMPTYQFEAMDATGQEIKDVIEAASQDEAQATIRQMGYFVTKISVKKSRKTAAEKKAKNKGKTFALGGVSTKKLTTFTRQLSILQDAGLPILRSLQDPRRAVEAGGLEERADRRLRRDRRRGHALRSDGQVAQGLRPAVREHDQGRRGGRCPGNDPQAPGRVPGAVASR